MKIPEKLKKALIIVVAVVAIVAFAFIFFLDTKDLYKMEDTNGADNYQLQYINDHNIINLDYGALGAPRVRDELVGSDIVLTSGNFTGIYDVFYTNLIGKSDFVLDLTEFTVKSGNLKAVIIHDDVIVKEIDFNDPELLFNDFRLDNINGTVHFRIAGEQADFTLRMPKSEYERFAHMK